jgi:hypothetical protein
MTAGGARPGAGRKPGKPNRTSELRVQEARQQGRRLPPENLLVVAENSMAMAARYQPGPKDKPNANFDEQKYAFWLAAAGEALKAAAPYYSPKLHAVAMQTSPLDDRQEADVPGKRCWKCILQ